VEEGIKSSWSNPVAVMLQLFHHRQAKERLMSGMDQHMDSNETGKEFPLM
jgi:hypothetical protein